MIYTWVQKLLSKIRRIRLNIADNFNSIHDGEKKVIGRKLQILVDALGFFMAVVVCAANI